MLMKAEAADHALSEEMDRLVIVKAAIYTSGELDPRAPLPPQDTRGKVQLDVPRSVSLQAEAQRSCWSCNPFRSTLV